MKKAEEENTQRIPLRQEAREVSFANLGVEAVQEEIPRLKSPSLAHQNSGSSLVGAVVDTHAGSYKEVSQSRPLEVGDADRDSPSKSRALETPPS
jgi:hypothetical protein